MRHARLVMAGLGREQDKRVPANHSAAGGDDGASCALGSTVLYCAVALVVTGMVIYYDLDSSAPLAQAFGVYGMYWAQILVSVGALLVRPAPHGAGSVWDAVRTCTRTPDTALAATGVAGRGPPPQALTTTILAGILGMPRIFLAMARDGLLFQVFKQIHPRFETPLVGTLFTGIVGMDEPRELPSPRPQAPAVADAAEVSSGARGGARGGWREGPLSSFVVLCIVPRDLSILPALDSGAAVHDAGH